MMICRFVQAAALAVSLCALTATVHAADRALLIGIDDYADDRLDSKVGTPASNDTDAVAAMLRQKFGIDAANIKILADKGATRDAILKELNDWVVHGTNEGDNVYLYFAGLGYYTEDQDGDEADGYDEGLVPHDATMELSGNKLKINGLITDDQLSYIIGKLHGRNVTLVTDASFSGHVTRGSAKSEDALIARAPYVRNASRSIVVDQGAQAQKAEGNFLDPVKPGVNLTAWTAASNSQMALLKEDKSGGLFTRLFIDGLGGNADRNGNGSVSNSELLSYISEKSAEYCRKHPGICELGLTPQLTPESAYAQTAAPATQKVAAVSGAGGAEQQQAVAVDQQQSTVDNQQQAPADNQQPQASGDNQQQAPADNQQQAPADNQQPQASSADVAQSSGNDQQLTKSANLQKVPGTGPQQPGSSDNQQAAANGQQAQVGDQQQASGGEKQQAQNGTQEVSGSGQPQQAADGSGQLSGTVAPATNALSADMVTDFLANGNTDGVSVTQIPEGVVYVGQRNIRFRVVSPHDGYLILLNLSDDGKLIQLYPNQYSRKRDGEGQVRAGAPLVVPDSYYGISFDATEVSSGLIIAVVARELPNWKSAVATRAIEIIPRKEAVTSFLPKIAAALGTPAASADPAKNTEPFNWSVATMRYEIKAKP